MKIYSTFIFTLCHLLLIAQSVGVKTSSPNTSLDVNGGVSYREGTALSLSNGVNSNIALADYSLFRITGPTTTFSITGFANGSDGRILTIFNATSYTMTLTHQATSSSANQLNTGGSSVTIATNGVASFIYNATLSKWVLTGGQGFPINGWSTTGNSGTSAGTNFLGTTDNQNLTIKAGNATALTVSNTTWGGMITYANNSSATYPSTTGYNNLTLPSNIDTSFSIVGSVGHDDFFAIYGNVPSVGSGTNGELHFQTGDDGNEPIIFEQFDQATNITTERFRIHSNGYIGVNTASPNVNLDIDGGLAIRPPSTINLTADNQSVTVGNESFIVLSTTNTTVGARTFTISNGLQNGQILVILFSGTGSQQCDIADTGNCNLVGGLTLDSADTISLIWYGSTWYETSRSKN